MAESFNVEWLNENAHRNYPLVDGASRIAGSGAVLPYGLLVDLSIQVPLGSLEPSRAFIRRVYGFSAGVVVTIGDISEPSQDLAVATLFTATHSRWKSYPIVGTPGSALAGAAGRVTIGLPEAVAQCSMALFDFSGNPEATRLVVSAVRPLLSGVTGITVAGGRSSSVVHGGAVTLRAGPGVTLGYDKDSGVLTISSNVTVTPSVAAAAGYRCSADKGEDRGCIRTINGIPPDENGDFRIDGLGGPEA